MATNPKTIPSTVVAYLERKTVLIIGGDKRPEQILRLKATFPATQFIWLPTRRSDASLDSFRQAILRDEVDVVILIHGLARTAHTKGTRSLCGEIRKPLLWCWRPTVAAIVRALSCARNPGLVVAQIGGEA